MNDFYTFSMLGRYGRLGNQMFQVAAMMCLAKRNGVDLVLPGSENALIRKVFDINCVDLTSDHIQALQGRWEEPSFCFQSIMYDLPPRVDVLGYLQSWRYILYEEDVRRAFTFREDVRDESARLLPEGELIAMHVRRGDYLKLPGVFPLPSLSYYRDAVSMIRQVRPESNPVVFTDDPAWCIQNFPETQIFSNSEVQDLCMMSMCKHHVIANSSFSWWGAWLAKSDDQIVYAPSTWFGSEGPQDTQDLLLKNYKRL